LPFVGDLHVLEDRNIAAAIVRLARTDYDLRMRSGLFQIIGLLCGLIAMLACLQTPAAAGSPMLPEAGGSHAAMDVTSDMPCCPDKGTAQLKVCSQPCAVIAVENFNMVYRPYIRPLRFRFGTSRGTGITYDPEAPPPR
jgi:hypothetical protein